MVYVCEFEFCGTEGQLVEAWPLSIEGEALGAPTYEEALQTACSWLGDVVDDAIIRGRHLPEPKLRCEPRRGGRVCCVGVERQLTDVPAVTATEAAAILGISRGRVSQLCASGALESWKEGASRLVSLRSILARREALL